MFMKPQLRAKMSIDWAAVDWLIFLDKKRAAAAHHCAAGLPSHLILLGRIHLSHTACLDKIKLIWRCFVL